MLQYEDELPVSSASQATPVKRFASRRNDRAMRFLSEDEVYPLPNVRRRRQNENEQARRLSQSTFNRISQTLGALNTMGNFFLNITREVTGEQSHRGDMQLVSSSSVTSEATATPSSTTTKKSTITTTTTGTTKSPASAGHSPVSTTEHTTTTIKQIIPAASSIITKTVPSPNVTKTIEPLIKRIGNDYSNNEKNTLIDKQTLSEKIDMAAMAEKKRKKHQATTSKKETTFTTFGTTIAPGLLGVSVSGEFLKFGGLSESSLCFWNSFQLKAIVSMGKTEKIVVLLRSEHPAVAKIWAFAQAYYWTFLGWETRCALSDCSFRASVVRLRMMNRYNTQRLDGKTRIAILSTEFCPISPKFHY